MQIARDPAFLPARPEGSHPCFHRDRKTTPGTLRDESPSSNLTPGAESLYHGRSLKSASFRGLSLVYLVSGDTKEQIVSIVQNENLLGQTLVYLFDKNFGDESRTLPCRTCGQ